MLYQPQIHPQVNTSKTPGKFTGDQAY